MAISGHNGNNETFIGMSSSTDLSLYDSNSNKIEITQSKSPIEILVPMDVSLLSYPYQYVNVTNNSLVNGAFFLQNAFNITPKPQNPLEVNIMII